MTNVYINDECICRSGKGTDWGSQGIFLTIKIFERKKNVKLIICTILNKVDYFPWKKSFLFFDCRALLFCYVRLVFYMLTQFINNIGVSCTLDVKTTVTQKFPFFVEPAKRQ